jgi:hypothetical protein
MTPENFTELKTLLEDIDRHISHLECMREQSKHCPLILEVVEDFEELLILAKRMIEYLEKKNETKIEEIRSQLRDALNEEYSLTGDK